MLCDPWLVILPYNAPVGALRRLAEWWIGITILAVILVVDATWRQVAPLVLFDGVLGAHRAGLLTLTITLTAVGAVRIVGCWVHGLITEGHRISEADLLAVAAAQFKTQLLASSGGSPTAGVSVSRFWGRAIGWSFEES
jgi:hypothetical protein